MSYGENVEIEDEGDEAPAISANVSGIAGLGNLPKVKVGVAKLKPLKVVDRLKFIGKEFYKSDVSGFAKGAIMHKLLDYTVGQFAKTSPVMSLYAKTAHALVNYFEIDSVLHGMVNVIDDTEATVSKHDSRRVERMVEQHISKKFFAGKPLHMYRWEDETDGISAGLSMIDIFHCLANIVPEIAEKYDFKMVYSEDFEENENRYCLYVFSLKQRVYGMSCRGPAKDVWYVQKVYAIYSEHGDWTAWRTLNETLSAMAKENFIRVVNPEKNMLEMGDRCMKILPRQQAFDNVPNMPIDAIKRSIKYGLDNRIRRVIALIGDPGLGKTNAMHAIVNSFPKIPTFVVSTSAMGYDNSATNVRAIFNAVSSIESILVIDDFDGYGLDKKNKTTNEFLLQLEGGRGFNGVAILIINDPSAVNATIMNRPGRIDEVWKVEYLTHPKDVISIITANFPDTEIKHDAPCIKYMINNRFSNARITEAARYALIHSGEITDATLLNAAKQAKQFEKNALLCTHKGKLIQDTPKNGRKPVAVSRTVDETDECEEESDD